MFSVHISAKIEYSYNNYDILSFYDYIVDTISETKLKVYYLKENIEVGVKTVVRTLFNILTKNLNYI